MKNNLTFRYETPDSRWSGVGPYYAMFPTKFATSVIQEYTKPGECIFDPFAGRGTSIFAAASEGRYGIGIEINPVGWVYGKAKLQTAERNNVEERIHWLGLKAKDFHETAKKLPEFFHYCFAQNVLDFLLAARNLLDWRRRKTDWTIMALLMIHLHGKREYSFSNQMRQTKAMSPQYSVRWWKEKNLKPPLRNPVDFMMKKIEWRYAKGHPIANMGQIYLGNCMLVLNELIKQPIRKKVKLLLTSPPYSGVTNYFYDQWLRLWLLGGPERPKSFLGENKGKFCSKKYYLRMLLTTFSKTKKILDRNATIYIRTDAREFTKETTIEALEQVFPNKKIRNESYSIPIFSQTSLFDLNIKSKGEVDLVMW